MNLKFFKISEVSNNTFTAKIDNYEFLVHQSMTGHCIEITISIHTDNKVTVLINKSKSKVIGSNISIPKGKKIVYPNDAYKSPIFTRLLKDYPNSSNENERVIQRKAYDRALTLVSDEFCIQALTYFAETIEDGDRKYYLTDFIKDFTADFKKIINDFIMKLLIQRLRKTFFSAITLNNKPEELDFYTSLLSFKVLTKDGNIKNNAVNNLFLINTNLSFDRAQSAVMRLIDDPDIEQKMSDQLKNPLTQNNIISL